jgi:hypothetical protein
MVQREDVRISGWSSVLLAQCEEYTWEKREKVEKVPLSVLVTSHCLHLLNLMLSGENLENLGKV